MLLTKRMEKEDKVKEEWRWKIQKLIKKMKNEIYWIFLREWSIKEKEEKEEWRMEDIWLFKSMEYLRERGKRRMEDGGYKINQENGG